MTCATRRAARPVHRRERAGYARAALIPGELTRGETLGPQTPFSGPEEPSPRVIFDYLSGIEMLMARRAALLGALEQAIPDSRHAQTIARLRCFRGIDTLTAAGLCAEIGDW